MRSLANKRALRAQVGMIVGQADSVTFDIVLAAARAALPELADEIDGQNVSRALRAMGFNRDYTIGTNKRPITYVRTGA